jgi:Ca2+-binding EF-hand superfamily protein
MRAEVSLSPASRPADSQPLFDTRKEIAMKFHTPLMALLALVSAAALAGSPAQEPKEKGALKLDINHDGQLSREEVKGHARLEKGFDRIDTNKDGFLSRDELESARARMKDQRGSRPASADR